MTTVTRPNLDEKTILEAIHVYCDPRKQSLPATYASAQWWAEYSNPGIYRVGFSDNRDPANLAVWLETASIALRVAGFFPETFIDEWGPRFLYVRLD